MLAQKQLYTVSRPNPYKDLKVKKTKRMAQICPGMSISAYPIQSLGVKIGDPFAITYKVYLHEHFAIVIDGGTAARGLYQNYHRDRFTQFPEYDTLTYSNHRIDRDLVLQTRAVYQNHISKAIPGLDWYVGAGVQWRFIDVSYEYTFEPIPNAPEIGFDSQSLNTFGPEFTGGVEYSYENWPVTAFFEINYFLAINAQPDLQRIMGGAGLRFRF
jgi:hypothetical protein